MYSSRPGARTAHIGFVRLARENLRFIKAEPDALRSPRDSSQDQLRAQDLEYSSRPKARTAHVGPARLAHQNLLLVGQNLVRRVLV